MKTLSKHKVLLLLLGVTLLVYLYAHWSGVCSQYIINDDVRQQIYWMQEWQDPDLYQDHYLTDYSKQYVPWGVQAIYWGASHFINPVQFSKILAAVLYVMTGGFLFILASNLRDELSGILTVCVFFHFGFFLGASSGGLSRGFVFPLLVLYLIFLSKDKTTKAGIVLMIQSLFNPYLFVLCLFTHGLYLAHTQWYCRAFSVQSVSNKLPVSPGYLLFLQLPVLAGILLMAAKHFIFANPAFGKLVSKDEMVNHIEYTAAGRYEIIPVPSMFYESIRHFLVDLPVGVLSISAALAGAAIFIYIVISGWYKFMVYRDILKLKFFIYLLIASVSLYFLSRIFLMKLFVPSRYLEYSLTVFYCVLAGLIVRSAIESSKIKKHIVLLVVLLATLGALRLHGVRLFDYRNQASLYQFLHTTPKSCLIAGHPEFMDSIMTFSQRKVFLSYELSHPFYKQYWSTIKARTYDFFNAYYSENPFEIKKFCRNYNIDYLVVKDRDFIINNQKGTSVYFEPFGKHIQGMMEKRSSYAVLDETIFRPIFQQNGIRVLTPLH